MTSAPVKIMYHYQGIFLLHHFVTCNHPKQNKRKPYWFNYEYNVAKNSFMVQTGVYYSRFRFVLSKK
jgi:hypothetical protein